MAAYHEKRFLHLTSYLWNVRQRFGYHRVSSSRHIKWYTLCPQKFNRWLDLRSRSTFGLYKSCHNNQHVVIKQSLLILFCASISFTSKAVDKRSNVCWPQMTLWGLSAKILIPKPSKSASVIIILRKIWWYDDYHGNQKHFDKFPLT